MAQALPVGELVEEAKCYGCYGPLTMQQLLTLAIERRAVLEADPAADVSPAALLANNSCVMCYGMSAFDVMEIGLLNLLQ